MGGVLVELGPITEIIGPGSTIGPEAFWKKWITSPTVRLFETGGCSPEEFGERLVEEFAVAISAEELVDHFAAWPKGLMAGATRLVEDLRGHVDLAVLSNTNALHWQHQADAAEVRGLFDRQYLSHEMGLIKPDAAIFEAVVADMDRRAEEILFVDDNQANVDGARSVGLAAELTRGVDQAREAIDRYGLGSTQIR